jgi:poly(glycerol-phosphate) alpha-glucosyltransferase
VREARVILPQGRQFALTWSIPDAYGGMTTAMLRRSRALVRLGGARVDVLTFDPELDAAATAQRLRDAGELIDGMRLLNLYDWFRMVPVRDDAGGTLDLERHPFVPLPGGGRTVVRTAEDGTILQLDHHRADGTIAVSDRRDVNEPGVVGGRSVVLCDADGNPVRSWGRLWGLYRFWLDELRRREPSFFIVDSKTMAPFALSYRRKRAVMLHLVHASHLSGTDPLGPLRESRSSVFEQLDGFDSVVLLTERQREDVLARGDADLHNLAVIPNSTELTRGGTARPDLGRGIVLASLDARKRVDHAIAAVRSVPGATLDVFGDGGQRAELERLAAGAPVTLHGHRPDARRRLASASYLLLTSSSEGFPLVLVEAMAAGCVPIAYDVPYGPSDLIVHGRNGFLVPAGDQDALAEAITTFLGLAPRRVAAMRRAAVRSARRFSDVETTRAWAKEERKAEQRKLAAWPQRLAG